MSVPLPAVDHIALSENDTLGVFVKGTPSPAKTAQLKRELETMAGVRRVEVQIRSDYTVLYLTLHDPTASNQMLAPVRALVKPRLPHNICLYVGPMSWKTATTNEVICGAVEFLETLEPTEFDRLLAMFQEQVALNGPVTLHHRHARFFVLSFEYVKSPKSIALTTIAERLGMFVNFFRPLDAPGEFSAEWVVEQLLGQHS